MKFKKIIALLLATVLTVSLTACGSQTPAAGSGTADEAQNEPAGGDDTASAATDDLLADIIPKETVTLDVYSQLANYSGEQIGWYAKILLDKFNVKLNIINDPDGVYETRMESGNLGDMVIWGNDSDEYLQAVERGMLFDWNEDNILADYAPYITENMPFALEKNKNLSGGTVYGYGFAVARDSSERQDAMYTWDIRWDLYKQLGYPEIKNLDDMVEVLAQMKDICPTGDNGKPTYGVSLFDDWDGDMVMFVKSTVSAYWGYDEFGFGFYDSTDQQYYPVLEEDGPYLQALKFYNTLYQRGLLDPDSQTQKAEGLQEDYQNGNAFLNIFNFLGSAVYNSEAHAAEGKAMYPAAPTEAEPIIYGQNVYGGNRIWSIGAKSNYPELVMAIYDWMATPEGYMTYNYGPKDICWYYDENGKTCFTEFGRIAKLDPVNTQMTEGYTGTFDDGYCKINNETWSLDSINPDSDEPYNYKKWASFATEAASDIEADWREYTGSNTPDEYFGDKPYRLAPGTTYSAGTKSDELTVLWNQVATCIKDNTWSAIYAPSDAEFDSIVADMMTQAKDYGYDECIAFQENEATIRAAAEDAVK